MFQYFVVLTLAVLFAGIGIQWLQRDSTNTQSPHKSNLVFEFVSKLTYSSDDTCAEEETVDYTLNYDVYTADSQCHANFDGFTPINDPGIVSNILIIFIYTN